jgi:flagellar biosynthesis protein FlhB
MAEGADDEDRTEEPTQRKLDEAINRGDVPRSQEISTFFVLGALTLALLITGAGSGRIIVGEMRGFLMNAHLVPDSGAGLLSAGTRGLWAGLSALVLPIGLIGIAALAGGLVQHRPLWTFEPVTPKFSRVSPMEGAKRIFGKQAWVQFVKGLAKIIIVGAVAATVLWGERDRLESFATLPLPLLLGAVLQLSIKLLGAILSIYAVVAIGDAVYQRMSWHKRQRMSKEEMKKEHKEQEGNPEIKGRMRQIAHQRLRKRMMAAVPSATVIITNPTHFAVALKYEAGMPAPICVAKGIDVLALRIRAVATENNVPVIENPPLARALHAAVEIDAEIPVEHYKAVAEVIGYVLRLKRRAS